MSVVRDSAMLRLVGLEYLVDRSFWKFGVVYTKSGNEHC